MLTHIAGRVWGFLTGGSENAVQLAELAEAVSGHTLDSAGTDVAVQDRIGRLDRLRRAVAQATDADRIRWFIRWFLTDRCTRNISPQSRVGVPVYLQRQESNADPALWSSCSARLLSDRRTSR